MTFRRGTRYRFLLFTFLLFGGFVVSAFAEEELSGAASATSAIITIGIAGFGLLFAYVAYLTGVFFLKTFKEFRQKAKEEDSHGHPKEKGQAALAFGFWIATLFAVGGAFVLFIAFLSANAGLDMKSTTAVSSFIITLALFVFSLVVLYLLYLLVASLLAQRAEVLSHREPAGVDASGIPLTPEVTRRSFLSLLGWAWVAFIAATTGALSTMLRFAFPNVTFEPPLKFKAGFPETFAPGVDERHKDAHRCWIVRTDTGFYALSTICTHLGCTPNWLSAEQKFKCPCHGSGYYMSGVNFEGPAPRPLERFQITLADDGQIEVDESVKFQSELGQWGLPGSFLNYKA